MPEHVVPIRVVLAKVGLDGHDRGIKVVARPLPRRRTARHLRRPLADAGSRRPHRRRRGRRLPRPVAALRRPHDAGAAHPAAPARGGSGQRRRPRRRHRPRGRRPETARHGRRPRLRARYRPCRHGRPSPGSGARHPMPDDLIDRFRQGDRLGVRTCSSAPPPRRRAWPTLLARLGPPTKQSRVVALTGHAGVGKSTLVGKLLEIIRQDEGRRWRCWPATHKVRCRGGALLGDGFRMPSRPDDDGVYIRSLAAAGGRGAIARATSTRSCACWRRSAST